MLTDRDLPTLHAAASALRDLYDEQNGRVAGVRLPEGPRGGARTDEVDAIWIGAYGLTERLNMDLKERGAMLEATAAGEAR